MRRSIALIVTFGLLACAILAGCGTGETASVAPAQTEAADPPSPGELAAAALEALDRERSAHYALDATLAFEGGAEGETPRTEELEIHVEGDADDERASAAVSVEARGQRFAAEILYRPDELFVNFLGTWYGGSTESFDTRRDDPRRELVTPERVRRHFEDVFDGEVTEGPLVDGKATWAYDGSLNVDGLRTVAETFGSRLDAGERAQLEELGEATAVRFVVSRDDSLLRRLEVDVQFGGNALGPRGASVESVEGRFVLRLSDFGKPVVLDVPERHRPLEELAQAFFGGLG
jgi:hypothetical protein